MLSPKSYFEELIAAQLQQFVHSIDKTQLSVRRPSSQLMQCFTVTWIICSDYSYMHLTIYVLYICCYFRAVAWTLEW